MSLVEVREAITRAHHDEWARVVAARISGVLTVLFLVFTEGYLATSPDTDPVRHDLTAETIRLTRLIRTLLPPQESRCRRYRHRYTNHAASVADHLSTP